YVIWATVTALRLSVAHLTMADNEAVFGIVVSLLVLYTCLIVAMSTAAAVVGERQQATWESLLAAPLTGAEIVLGYLLGRAGPVLCGVLVAIGAWAATEPHYSMLFEPVGGLSISPGEFFLFGIAMSVRLLTLGAVGIAISA